MSLHKSKDEGLGGKEGKEGSELSFDVDCPTSCFISGELICLSFQSRRYARLKQRNQNTIGRNKVNGSSLNNTSVKFVPPSPSLSHSAPPSSSVSSLLTRHLDPDSISPSLPLLTASLQPSTKQQDPLVPFTSPQPRRTNGILERNLTLPSLKHPPPLDETSPCLLLLLETTTATSTTLLNLSQIDANEPSHPSSTPSQEQLELSLPSATSSSLASES